MEYLNQVIKEKVNSYDNLRDKNLIGSMCLFLPREIVTAVNAMTVQLSRFSGMIEKKDKFIEDINSNIFGDDICLHSKIYFVNQLPDNCPKPKCFIVPTTCDPLTKMYGYLSDYYPLKYLSLPRNRQGVQAQNYWNEQIRGIKTFLEELTGINCTYDRLIESVRTHNVLRKQIRKIMETRKNDYPIISASDVRKIHSIYMALEPSDCLTILQRIEREIDKSISKNRTKPDIRAPRIMYMSTTTRDFTIVPRNSGNKTTQELIEESGGVIVCEEACSTQLYAYDIEENLDMEQLLTNIANHYLDKIYCPCFISENRWHQNILQSVKEYNIEGIIIRGLKFCRHFNGLFFNLKAMLDGLGIPVLYYEGTGEIEQGSGKLRTQIEAFIEMLQTKYNY